MELQDGQCLCSMAGAPKTLVRTSLHITPDNQHLRWFPLKTPVPPAPRALKWGPTGVLQSGVEPQTTDPARGGPHQRPRLESSLPVMLAAPAFHLPSNQAEPGGPTAGDRPPPPLRTHLLTLPSSMATLTGPHATLLKKRPCPF